MRGTTNELIASVGPPRPSRGGLYANEVVRLSPLCYSVLITNTLKRTRSKRYKLTTRLNRPSPSVSRVFTPSPPCRRCLGGLTFLLLCSRDAALEKNEGAISRSRIWTNISSRRSFLSHRSSRSESSPMETFQSSPLCLSRKI